jgi:catalase
VLAGELSAQAAIIEAGCGKRRLAAPGDKIDYPSVAWASTNKVTTLGTLTAASVVPDSEATERALLFLPALLPAGIEAADPMIQFRNKTYPVSYERRHP